MKKSTKKLYTRKRPAHPDEAHSKNKRWFKRKGRKAVRKHLKQELKKCSPYRRGTELKKEFKNEF